MADPKNIAVVNLVGLPLTERPSFFLALLPRLQELRVRTGHPHWLAIDEAHHLMPADWEPAALTLPQELAGMLLLTVHPDQVSPAVLGRIDTIIAVGPNPADTLGPFCAALGEPSPADVPQDVPPGEVTFWRRGGEGPFLLRPTPGTMERRRHSRKYAQGELPPDRSFYFRGPDGKLNLRAQNLILFLQMADGVDDDTWMHHLLQGDYSRWFREAIKDDMLAAEAARVEGLDKVSPAESRELIRQVVEQRYTLPSAPTLPMPGTDAAPARP